jgi:putative transcriptional regulator
LGKIALGGPSVWSSAVTAQASAASLNVDFNIGKTEVSNSGAPLNRLRSPMRTELSEKIAGEITLSANPGSTIKKWRSTFEISQQDLARHLKLSPSVISDYEGGRRKSPRVDSIRRIVDGLIEIDVQRGSRVLKKYGVSARDDSILGIREFPVGIPAKRVIEVIAGQVLACPEHLERDLYGFTMLDSVKAIMQLSSFDYLKVYGWSTERALIFSSVEYGRSPMVAIRAHPLKPAVVVFHKPGQIDPLAIKLAELERIPLVRTDMEQDQILGELGRL